MFRAGCSILVQVGLSLHVLQAHPKSPVGRKDVDMRPQPCMCMQVFPGQEVCKALVQVLLSASPCCPLRSGLMSISIEILIGIYPMCMGGPPDGGRTRCALRR